jgi:TP901 family phage tail tape measure protein
MALNNLGLGFIFTAKDHASRTIDNISKSLTRMERAQTAAQKVMQAGAAMMVASMAGLVAGKKLLDGAWFVASASGLFEQRVQHLGVVAEATTEELKKMRAMALDTTSSAQFAPLEKVSALNELAQVGFTAKQSMEALEGALNFATAAELSGARSASTMAAAMQVFNLKATDAAMISDKLMKTSTSTAIAVGDLEHMMGTVARGSGAMEQSFTATLVAMGIVKGLGVDASVAASSVSAGMLEISDNYKSLKKELGVDVLDASGNFKDFTAIVLETNNALSSLSKVEYVNKVKELTGRFGMTSFIGIIKKLEQGVETTNGKILKFGDAVKYMNSRINDSAGLTEKFKNALLDSLPGQVLILRNTFDALTISVGKAFSEFTRPGVEKVIEFINLLKTKFEALPPSVQGAIAVATYTASAVLILGSALLFAVGAFAVLAPALPIAIGALKGLLAACWPIVLVAAALGLAFVTVKAAFERNIGGFGDRATKMFNKVKLAFQGVYQFMTQGFASGGIAKELAKGENKGILDFVRVVVGYAFRIKKFFEGIGEGFMLAVDQMGPAFSLIMSALEDLGNHLGIFSAETADTIGSSDKWKKFGIGVGFLLGEIVHGIVLAVGIVTRGIGAIVKTFLWLSSVVSYVIDYVVTNFTKLVESQLELKAIVKATWAAIVSTYYYAAGAIGSAIDSAVDWVVSGVSSIFGAISGIAKSVWEAVTGFLGKNKDEQMVVIDSLIAKWQYFADTVAIIWGSFGVLYDGIANKVSEFKDTISADITAKVENVGLTGPKLAVPANSPEYLPTVGNATGAQNQRAAITYAVSAAIPENPELAVPSQGAKKRGLTAEEVQTAMQNALASHSRNNQRKPEVATLILDGEKVGQVVRGGARGRAANAFTEGEWGEG